MRSPTRRAEWGRPRRRSTSAPASPSSAADAGRRPRLAVQLDRRARPRPRRAPLHLRLPLRRYLGRRGGPADARRRQPLGRAREPRPRRRRGRAAEPRELAPTASARASARSASASPRRCSTARRRSARSPSTRSPPPIARSFRSRPSTWLWRAWSSSSTRCRPSAARLNPGLVLTGLLITMADERTRLAQDVERRVANPLPRTGPEDGRARAACGSRRRRASRCRSPSTRPARAAPSPTGRSPRRCSPVASRKAGIGRGLAAILPEPERRAARSCARSRSGWSAPEPRPAAQELRPRGKLERLAASVAEAGVIQPLVVHAR